MTGDDVYAFGYDADESKRAERLAESTVEARLEFPLVDHCLDKAACHALCEQWGVKRPAMYDLGYGNNNCIGRVKGGKGYWNRIRSGFPDVFKRRAKQEREVGHSCINGVFLDELDPEAGRGLKEIMPECSFMRLAVDGAAR